ncbi:MAG: AAA family ATPase [Bacteroidales bacterium]|nr:AAA family ATPase [Bacteroidales bacterium]
MVKTSRCVGNRGIKMGTSNDLPKTAIEAFNAFLENFVQGKSYVLSTEQSDLFSEESLKATYNKYCSNSKDNSGKDKKFDDVIMAMRRESNEVSLETMIDIINHAVWLWALPNNRKASWIPISSEKRVKGKQSESRMNDDLMKVAGVAGGGSGYVQTKTNGVRFVLFLFTQIANNKEIDEKLCKVINKVKIINACKLNTYCCATNNTSSIEYDVPDGVKNLLLHLCNYKKYESIASSVDKTKIVKAFWILSKDMKKEEEAMEDKDVSIKKIIHAFKETNSDFFYKDSYPLVWKGESITDLSLSQKLEYKKAMILYGPPGTGKTYTAMQLAKEIVLRYYMKEYKNKIDENKYDDNQRAEQLQKILNIDKEIENRIDYLQFHINYNYEDFVVGQIIENGTVKTKRGFIFDVIAKAKNYPQIPYVVILDEINRTDISRVFGELFTAIEKRGKEVTLTIKKGLTLNVPENVYFIGTMNEIDFSLERVDFALRRRFVWELLDYSEDALEDIIIERLNDKPVDGEKLNRYIDLCTSLNKVVKDLMGETYHVGHAFFAEIADIYLKLIENNVGGDEWNKAQKILWQISIKPTLEAYCGTMDKSDKDEYLKESGKFYKAFFGK